MFKRTKYTAEEKYEILKAYDNGSDTMKEILIKYNSSADTFYKWKYNYSKYGLDRLRKPETYKKYSKELKQLAVKNYLSGQFSQREIVKKYEIS